ncbi:MAG: DNA-methyltransferase [Fusobacteriaceae bacterium]
MNSELNKIIQGNTVNLIKTLAVESIDCVVTSPPYWRLRDYGHNEQMGIEETPEEFIENLCNIFDDVYRALKKTGTLFVNLGDSYSGSNTISQTGRKGFYKDEKNIILKKENCIAKKKSLIGIPAMFQLEMVKRGWRLRNKIIWNKTNVMPESVKDRFTNDYEEIFFFTKSEKYYFNQLYEPYAEKTLNSFKNNTVPTSHAYLKAGISKSGMRTGKDWLAVTSDKGRKMRTVWRIGTTGTKYSHYSTFPSEIAKRCLQSGCPENGLVLDPFLGSGTVLLEANKQKKNCVGFELLSENIEIIYNRINSGGLKCL